MNTTTKNRKPLYIAFIVLALVGICAAIYLFVPDTNTSKNAVHIDSVSEAGQNAYIDFVSISPAYASYSGYEDLGMYILEDRDGTLYNAILDKSQAEKFKTQSTFFWYGSDYSTAPSARITGQAVKMESSEKKYAIAFINDLFEEDVLNSSNFEDYLGAYALNANVSTTSYGSFLAAVIIMFLSLALLAIGVYNIVGPKNIADDEKHRYGLALVCGFIGLFIATLIPMALGMFAKLVSFYAMIAIPIGFTIGYGIIEKKMPLVTKLLFIVSSGIMGFVSMWMVYAWLYYKQLNSLGMTYFKSIATLGSNINNFQQPGTVKMHMIMAALVAFVVAIVVAVSKSNKQDKKMGPDYEYMNTQAMDNFQEQTRTDEKEAGSVNDTTFTDF